MAYTPGTAAVNGNGALAVFDSEAPAIFTGRVIADVTAGQFVYCSGTLGTTMGSNASDFTPSDLNLAPSALDVCNGIALSTVVSGTNNYVAVARRGAYLVSAGGPCSGGTAVFLSSGGVATAAITVGSGNIIGRSFNAIGKGLFGLVSLNM